MNNKAALSKNYNGRGHYGISLNNIKKFSKPLLEDLAKEMNRSVISLKKKFR